MDKEPTLGLTVKNTRGLGSMDFSMERDSKLLVMEPSTTANGEMAFPKERGSASTQTAQGMKASGKTDSLMAEELNLILMGHNTTVTGNTAKLLAKE